MELLSSAGLESMTFVSASLQNGHFTSLSSCWAISLSFFSEMRNPTVFCAGPKTAKKNTHFFAAPDPLLFNYVYHTPQSVDSQAHITLYLAFFLSFFQIYFHQDDVTPYLTDVTVRNDVLLFSDQKSAEAARPGNDNRQKTARVMEQLLTAMVLRSVMLLLRWTVTSRLAAVWII